MDIKIAYTFRHLKIKNKLLEYNKYLRVDEDFGIKGTTVKKRVVSIYFGRKAIALNFSRSRSSIAILSRDRVITITITIRKSRDKCKPSKEEGVPFYRMLFQRAQ